MIVLFREDPNTHKEVYLTRTRAGFDKVKSPLLSSLRFDTLADAYRFGDENNLLWWKVGRR